MASLVLTASSCFVVPLFAQRQVVDVVVEIKDDVVLNNHIKPEKKALVAQAEARLASALACALKPHGRLYLWRPCSEDAFPAGQPAVGQLIATVSRTDKDVVELRFSTKVRPGQKFPDLISDKLPNWTLYEPSEEKNANNVQKFETPLEGRIRARAGADPKLSEELLDGFLDYVPIAVSVTIPEDPSPATAREKGKPEEGAQDLAIVVPIDWNDFDEPSNLFKLVFDVPKGPVRPGQKEDEVPVDLFVTQAYKTAEGSVGTYVHECGAHKIAFPSYKHDLGPKVLCDKTMKITDAEELRKIRQGVPRKNLASAHVLLVHDKPQGGK